MVALNGYSSATTEVIAKWAGGIYRYQTNEQCPWTSKTVRLAVNTPNYTGVGFDELFDSAAFSPGYGLYEFTTPTPFQDIAYGIPNYDPYITTTQDVAFPVAGVGWQTIKYVGVFGENNVTLTGDPAQYIFGFEMIPFLALLEYQQLVYLAGNIKVALQTKYHV